MKATVPTTVAVFALAGWAAMPGMSYAQTGAAPGMDRSVTYDVQVLDADGKPIETAELTVTTAAARPGGDTFLSDAGGNAKLDPKAIDPSRGADVTIRARGFRDGHLHLSPEGPRTLVARLERAPDSGDIVVRARRVSRPFSPSTLGLLDIVTDARANADPILAANDLPSSTNVAGNATLSLRATRPSISRLYLDDVPVFEFVRGGSLDSATQSGSILNLGNTKDVEVYPSNPPLYLAGSSGGALRALPPTAANTGVNVSVNTAAAGLTGTLAPGSGGSFITLSGLYSNLEPQLAINGSLSDLISRLRLRSVGLVGRASLQDQSALSGFAQAESEDGRYPVDLYGDRVQFRQNTDRIRAISGYTRSIGGEVVTISASYTHSNTKQAFAGSSSNSQNRYIFLGADLGGSALDARMTYRIGVDADDTRQSSREVFGDTLLPIGSAAPTHVNNRNTEVSAYAFASYRLSPAILVSAGGRHTISTDLTRALSFQGSMTLTTADKRHKIIVSAGRYFGVELPQFAYDGGLARSRSNQVEADYVFSVATLRLGVSAYHSVETSDRTRSALSDGRFYVFSDALTGIGRRSETTGVEAFAVASPLRGMEVKASVSRIGQTLRVGTVAAPGANDFGYIARGSVRYQLGMWGLNVAATTRQGAPFTRVVGYEMGRDVARIPSLGPLNGARLPPYFAIDFSVARPIALSSSIRPLAFLSINNLFNRHNASAQELSDDAAILRLRNYPGRVLTAGISLNL